MPPESEARSVHHNATAAFVSYSIAVFDVHQRILAHGCWRDCPIGHVQDYFAIRPRGDLVQSEPTLLKRLKTLARSCHPRLPLLQRVDGVAGP